MNPTNRSSAPTLGLALLALCAASCGSSSSPADDAGASTDQRAEEPLVDGQPADHDRTERSGADQGPAVSASPLTWHRRQVDADSFAGLHGSAPDDVWAVTRGGRVYHFDGAAWSLHTTIAGGPLKAVLAISDQDAWIAQDYPGTVYRFNGGAWVEQPADFGVSSVYALWGSGPQDVWLGTQWNFYTAASHHFDGTTWSGIDLGHDGGVHALWGSGPTDVWALVAAGQQLRLQRYDGSGWQPPTGEVPVTALWGAASDDLWAVGDEVLRHDGSGWQPVEVPAQQGSLAAVWGSARDSVWAVGDRQVLRFDGNGWQAVTQPGVPAGGSRLWVGRAGAAESVHIAKGPFLYWGQGLTPACDAGEARCGELCVDLASDPEHCGGCGSSCGTDGVCSPTGCGCSDPQETFCGDRCVDMQSDVTSCGGCGKRCPTGGTCTAGVCGCAAGTTPCGDTCVSLQSDEANCGACGKACPADRKCDGGVCVCPTWQLECDGACVSPTSDAQHCGSCDNACAVACSEGACVTATSISAGPLFSCAALSDGTVRCWGYREFNATQPGKAITRPLQVGGVADAAAISGGGGDGYLHMQETCAVIGAAGEVRCWRQSNSSSTLIAGLSGVVQVAVGTNQGEGMKCARLASGTVRCWGNSYYGLGDGTSTQSTTPVEAALGGATIVDLDVGHGTACAVTAEHKVWCWGDHFGGSWDKSPVLLSAPTTAAGVAVGTSVYVLHTDGSVSAGLTAPTSPISGLSNVVQLDASPTLLSQHTCALRADATLACWGSNNAGQLGIGSVGASVSTPTTIASLGGVAQVALGGQHTCARTAAGAVYCWGSNGYGELGNGDTANRDAPTLVVW